MSLFELRFALAGSLCLSSNEAYTVGPIMSPKYFKFTDGRLVNTDANVQHKLHQFRGPFSNTSDQLSSPMKADIFALSSRPSPSPPCVGGLHPRDSLLALKVIHETVELCSKYPGGRPVVGGISLKPFSMYGGFNLSNIMVLFIHAVHRYFNSVRRSHRDRVGWCEVAQ